MLNLNESKDWFDNYSKAGKNITRFNKILSDAKKKLKSNPNKITKVNICPEIAAFEARERKKEQMDDLMNDELDIFKELTEEEKKNKQLNNRYLSQKLLLKQKYKYHNKHMSHLRKMEKEYNPPCTKYNPKYDSILRTTQSIPALKTQSGRKPLNKKEIYDKFYLEHENIIDTMAGSAFIDMSKQPIKQSTIDYQENIKDKEFLLDNYSFINLNNTKSNLEYHYYNDNTNRPSSAITKEFTKNSSKISNKSSADINDIGYNKKYSSASFRTNSAKNININKKILKNILEKKQKKGKTNFDISNISDIKPDINLQENINININDLSNNNISINKSKNKKDKDQVPQNVIMSNTMISSNINNKSIDVYNRYYYKRMKNIISKNSPHNVNTINKIRNKNIRKRLRKSRINAPDFSKSLSRDSYDKKKENKDLFIPFLIPKFNLVRERPIMMVSYKEKHSTNKKRSKSSRLENVNYSYYFDADKNLDKINNHLTTRVPNFDLMSSRPIDNDPLPSYMKKIVNRTVSGLTEFSLNMNNYKNRDFGNLRTSFFPKKSFNKVINLNLMKSKKFFGNIIFGESRRKFGKRNPLMAKIIRFYNRNYEAIINEKNLDKFDNVTYKGYSNIERKKIFK